MCWDNSLVVMDYLGMNNDDKSHKNVGKMITNVLVAFRDRFI